MREAFSSLRKTPSWKPSRVYAIGAKAGFAATFFVPDLTLHATSDSSFDQEQHLPYDVVFLPGDQAAEWESIEHRIWRAFDLVQRFGLPRTHSEVSRTSMQLLGEALREAG